MNKRIIYIVISLMLVALGAWAVFSGVTKNEPTNSDQEHTSSDPVQNSGNKGDAAVNSDGTVTSDGDKKDDESKNTNKKSTLLIYMIGSDLESRSAAGTNDMEELEKSGIDLTKNKVVVFAGGATRWHNDITSAEKINILELTKSGFKSVSKMDAASMGTAESLSEFLNYGYKNYPADSFALVMWDHGNGPNIGYGKDIIYDGDSLTLAEMKTALSTSPFGPDNKLEWVGFDACLMSSAELVCILDDYAKYLVASQEIEPSFGWNYDVFKPYNTMATTKFLTDMTNNYLSSCLEYYNKKGYENKDITLSCMDLSYGPQMEEAVNALFAKLKTDVSVNYDNIVRQRVATRGLGRASTGSEYDLVDLYDMATQLKGLYPEECARLTDVIDKMIINNGTNAQLCCGISLYYPFYNKYYYEKGWSEAYKNIGVFDSYREFLQAYQQTWLADEDLEKYEKSPTPQKVQDANRSSGIEGTYMLPLSPEQNANYAEAKVYVMERSFHANSYQNIITSANVTNEGGVLYATIDGKAIYAKDNYGNRSIPVTTVNDVVGDITRLTCRITARTRLLNSILYDDTSSLDIQFALNGATEELSTVGVFPYNPPTRANEISSGKLEDADLSLYDVYWFPRFSYRYPVRNSNGLMLPIDKWIYDGAFYTDVFTKENGLNFVYEPMDANTYYVMFEITDTNGAKYCSELLEIVPPQQEQSYAGPQVKPDDIIIDWKTGSETEIYNRNNVIITVRNQYGYTGSPEHKLIVRNNNDYTIEARLDDVTLNGMCVDYSHLQVPPHSEEEASLYSFYLDIEPFAELGMINTIDHIEGVLSISQNSGALITEKNQKIIINCSEETGFTDLSRHVLSLKTPKSFMGALAEKQLLYEDDKTRITLVMFGGISSASNAGYVLLENLSDETRSIACDGLSVNNKTLSKSIARNPIPGKSYCFQNIMLSIDLSEQKINRIESLALRFSAGSDEMTKLFDTPDGGKWFPVVLKEHAKESPENIIGEIVYDKHNITITVTDFKIEKMYSSNPYPMWYAFVKNDSDYDISLRLSSENDTSSTQMRVSDAIIGAHQGAYVQFKWDGEFELPKTENEPMPSASFKVHIMDYNDDNVLFAADELTTLRAFESKDKTIYGEITSGEKTKIASAQDVTLYVEKSKNSANQTTYSFTADSSTDSKIYVKLENICINDSIVIDDWISFYTKDSILNSDSPDLGKLLELGAVDSIDSISGELTVQNQSENYYILEKHPLKITFTGEGKFDPASSGYKKADIEPYADALAQKQVLVENDDIRITLMHFGKYDQYDASAYICFENLSDNVQEIYTQTISVNAVTGSITNAVSLDPGKMEFKEFNLSDAWFAENSIQSIESLSIRFRVRERISGINSPYEHFVSDILLKEHGIATPPEYGDNVIFDNGEVKIILNKFMYKIGAGSFEEPLIPTWYLTVINNSDINIDISDMCSTEFDKMGININLSETLVAANERINCTLTSGKKLKDNALPLYVIIKNWDGERIFTDSKETVFVAEDKFTLTPHMDILANEQILWETDEFRLKLKYIGNHSQFKSNALLCLENLSNKHQSFSVSAISLNSHTIQLYTSIEAGANSISYSALNIPETLINSQGIESVETMEICLLRYETPYSKTPYDIKWCNVELAQHGKMSEFVPGENVIFDKSGVKMILDGFEYLEDGRAAWNVTVINSTDNYINFIQGTPGSLSYAYHDTAASDIVWISYATYVGPNRIAKGKIHYNSTTKKYDTLNLNLAINDIYENRLFTDDEIITLYTGDGKKFTKTKIE